jgi:uncharacterized membrane protein (UPF0127 family)
MDENLTFEIMKKFVFFAFITVFLTSFMGCSMNFFDANEVTVKTELGEHVFQVELALDEEDRYQGLMNRQAMGLDEGMFFVFEEPQKLYFYMKNMLFPLDIVFISADLKVLNVAANVPPCRSEKCVNYESDGDAQYVLELNAGRAKEIGLKRGNEVAVNFSL